MPDINFARQINRAFRTVSAVLLPLVLVLACKAKDGGTGNVENAQTWSPAKLTSVQGVPATEIEAVMKRRLGGDRPAKIDDDQWGHTERLYRLYGLPTQFFVGPDGAIRSIVLAPLNDTALRAPVKQPSVLERVLHQDRIVALWRRRQQRHRALD